MGYVVANLKMKHTLEEMKEYLETIKVNVDKKNKVIICPSSIYLNMFKSNNFSLGAQNAYYGEKGSYTGEVSPLQLKGLGVEYVIIGHSERRKHLNETDDLISKKIESVLKQNMCPILCVGETIEEKGMHKTSIVIKNQLLKGLSLITDNMIEDVIIAYEPVWAIGGKDTCSNKDIEEITSYIKGLIKAKYNIDIPVLYGGSVNPGNIKEINKISNIDGVLVGTASVNPHEFIEVVDKASEF